MSISIGMTETRGFSTVVEAADAMVKATAEDEKLKVKQSDAIIKAVAEDERMKLERDKELLGLRSKRS